MSELICEHCHQPTKSLVIHDKELWCWPCHYETKGTQGKAPNVITDDIPGGVEIKHGICNQDGSPKKYYSKSSIRRAAYEAGYFQGTDTPKSNPRIVEERQRQKESR